MFLLFIFSISVVKALKHETMQYPRFLYQLKKIVE